MPWNIHFYNVSAFEEPVSMRRNSLPISSIVEDPKDRLIYCRKWDTDFLNEILIEHQYEIATYKMNPNRQCKLSAKAQQMMSCIKIMAAKMDRFVGIVTELRPQCNFSNLWKNGFMLQYPSQKLSDKIVEE